MATYTKVPRNVPSAQRTTLITAVAAGDQIDVEDVLGRPARGVIFEMTDAADTITYKLNNLVRLTSHNETGADPDVNVWSSGGAYSTFSNTGAAQHQTVSDLKVSSIEVVSLTLSTGTTIEIVVW